MEGKQVNFLHKLLFGSGGSTASVAKDRLRLVLSHDRTDISPQLLENLRSEMIAVLTKYMDIDESHIELDLNRDEREVALVANIPVVRVRRGSGTVNSGIGSRSMENDRASRQGESPEKDEDDSFERDFREPRAPRPNANRRRRR
jgi:cell division topological specificity factor